MHMHMHTHTHMLARAGTLVWQADGYVRDMWLRLRRTGACAAELPVVPAEARLRLLEAEIARLQRVALWLGADFPELAAERSTAQSVSANSSPEAAGKC